MTGHKRGGYQTLVSECRPYFDNRFVVVMLYVALPMTSGFVEVPAHQCLSVPGLPWELPA
jgi:hypothetical protein